MILALAAILAIQDTGRISEAQSVLSQLVESYGVSGMEAPVRATVQRLLPSWAKTETDTAGNLWVRMGQGDGPVVIVAHLDEAIKELEAVETARPFRVLPGGKDRDER